MPHSDRRRATYGAAVQAAIDAAPPVGPAERQRLSRIWRVSGSELVFPEATESRLSPYSSQTRSTRLGSKIGDRTLAARTRTAPRLPSRAARRSATDIRSQSARSRAGSLIGLALRASHWGVPTILDSDSLLRGSVH